MLGGTGAEGLGETSMAGCDQCLRSTNAKRSLAFLCQQWAQNSEPQEYAIIRIKLKIKP